jgi:Holliday junction resolvase-like predicted endonuclease
MMPKAKHNQTIGNQGERLVQHYFERKGFTLAHANWRKHGIGELDLIMMHPLEKRLLMIEVKARLATDASGEESALRAAFSPIKQHRLQLLTEAYLAQHPAVETYALELLWVTVQGCATEGGRGASITCYPLTF